MALAFDHQHNLINVTGGTALGFYNLSVQSLINAIRDEEASERGILYPQIATASGKEDLGSDVYVGMSVNLISPWQVKFEEGNYIAKIAGGNLVGGISGDPVAYSAGVQTLLIQSAASTLVVTGGSALTQEEHDAVMAAVPLVVDENWTAVIPRVYTGE